MTTKDGDGSLPLCIGKFYSVSMHCTYWYQMAVFYQLHLGQLAGRHHQIHVSTTLETSHLINQYLFWDVYSEIKAN